MSSRIVFTLSVVVLWMVLGAPAQDKKSSAASASSTVAILPFQDLSGSDYGDQLKAVLAKQLQAAILSGTKLNSRLVKLENEEADSSDIDVEGAVKLAKPYKAQLAVMGSLLSADVEENENDASGPSFGGVSVSGSSRSQTATVVLQAEIVDVGRGEKLASLRATGKNHQGKIGASVSTSYGSMDMGSPEFSKTALGKATQAAMADLVSQITKTSQNFVPAGGTAEPAPSPAPLSEVTTPAPPAPQPSTNEVASEPAASEHPASSCQIVFRVILTDSMTPIRDYTITVQGRDLSSEVKDGILRLKNPDSQLQIQVRLKNSPPGINVQPEYTGRIESKCDKPQKVVVLEIGSDGSGRFNLHGG